MRKISFVLFCFLLIQKITSQTFDIIPSTYTAANASVADNKYYSAFKNPATSAVFSGTLIGLQYENKYIVDALAKKSMFITTHTNLINIGIAATYTGYELHNELMTGILLSRNFQNIFQLGLQYNYYSIYLAEANKRYASFFPQVGVVVKISPSVNIGFSTFNPGQQSIQLKYVKKQIPTIFSIGGDWKISENLDLLFQTDKNMSGNYRFAGGFEYDIKNFITFKTGAYHTEYLIPTVGFGLKLRTFDFHLNSELHPILGLTTFAAIQYSISKK